MNPIFMKTIKTESFTAFYLANQAKAHYQRKEIIYQLIEKKDESTTIVLSILKQQFSKEASYYNSCISEANTIYSQKQLPEIIHPKNKKNYTQWIHQFTKNLLQAKTTSDLDYNTTIFASH